MKFLPSYSSEPGPREHKYTRGVVGIATGSREFPGAALLGVTAAARCGPGMVRYVGPAHVADMLLAHRPEVVASTFEHTPGRAQAWVVGSGWPEDAESSAEAWRRVHRWLRDGSPDAALVVDAGALAHITRPEEGEAPPVRVLTPHAGEAAALAARLIEPGSTAPERRDIEAEPRAWAQAIARASHSVVVLKGHTSVIAGPRGSADHSFLEVQAPTTRLATAGSGDVLAGIIGALIAMHHRELFSRADHLDARAQDTILMEVCAAAVELHGYGALLAARRNAGRGDTGEQMWHVDPRGGEVHAPILAADICEAIPAVIAAALAKRS